MFFALLNYFSLAWPCRNAWDRAKTMKRCTLLHFFNFRVERINQLLSSAKGNKFSRLKQQLLQQIAKLKGDRKTCLMCFRRSQSGCTKHC